MTKGKIRFLFILACALAGISLGVGVGVAIAGLTQKVGLYVLSSVSIMTLALFAISITLLLFVAIAYHKRTLNNKAVSPYFAKPSRCKDLHFIASETKKNAHAKVLILSYYDPRDAEKGGLLHQASVNAAIEKFFGDEILNFAQPNRFVFFVLPEEEKVYDERFAVLSKKLKTKDLSLRLLIGVSSSNVERDFQKAYNEAIAALEERYPVRESLSKIVYNEISSASPIAGLSPIEKEFVSPSKETLALYPFGYGGHPSDLSFLGELGHGEDYEQAAIALAKAKLEQRSGKIGIYFSPTSFHTSSFYLLLNAFPDKKRLIVFLPAKENEPKLAFAAKKIRRLGCLVGYYGVDSSVVISRLELDHAYLYLDESFYEEDSSIVKAKKRLFAIHNAVTLGVRKEEGFVLNEGGNEE